MKALERFELNWAELQKFAQEIHLKLQGQQLNTIFIPKRPLALEGFEKNEWVLAFEQEFLYCSCRTQKAFLSFVQHHKLKAAKGVSFSPFLLILKKHLVGKIITQSSYVKKERILCLSFFETPPFYLFAMVLIPKNPLALLLEATSPLIGPFDQHASFRLIASSDPKHRLLTGMNLGKSVLGEFFHFPDGKNAPDLSQESKGEAPEKFLFEQEQISQEKELSNLREALQTSLKQSQKKMESLYCTFKALHKSSDFQKLGELLKGAFEEKEIIQRPQGPYKPIWNPVDEQWIEIAWQGNLSNQALAAVFFEKAQKLKRKKEELVLLLAQAEENVSFWQGLISELHKNNILEIKKRSQLFESSKKLKKQDTEASYGLFYSQEGFPIRVGKNLKENLDLTFKQARGRDIWMHLRGRPSAHVVIGMEPHKSASLETLLDACHVLLFYSGEKNQKKCEVDYTLKKFVKRIESQAIYSQNKTLLVDWDEQRWQKLRNRKV